MSVTLDLPPNILEQAGTKAASEGISLEALIIRALEAITREQEPVQAPSEPIQKMGLFPGAVLYMADDFDDIPEGFEDYV